MTEINNITAVILSGGLARRFNRVEKGLQHFAGKALITHIIERLEPQICKIFLNINRLHHEYVQQYPNIPYYSDNLNGFQGPLSGMLSGFEQIESEYLLFVPCDSPFIPRNLCQKLATALRINQAQIAYAHDGKRAHPTFCLLHRSIVPALADYLASGERRVLQFFHSQPYVAVDFSEQPNAFQNFNSAEELASGQIFPLFCKIPILAITGYSGTGKTTLLEKLIPHLSEKGLKVGLIKHSHHNVDIDKAGKDSYRLRQVGANPTMIACEQRWALMTETQTMVSFETLVAQFADKELDLILVEGFKHEQLPKIQLHRKAIEKPLPEIDVFTIATATDYPTERKNLLNINNIEQIARFISDYIKGK
ncbi:molybdenum cofactor guanylyltransferase MobA [Ursidibacter sp. B-7004-1]